MSGNHNSTINHNKDFLTNDLKLVQNRNSTIFENNKYFVLSPSVQNKNNWFDLRKINLEKKPDNKQAILLIRLLNGFILLQLDKIVSNLFDDEPYNTSNSGIHWKFQIRKNENGEEYIVNMKTRKKLFVERKKKNQVLELLNNR